MSDLKQRIEPLPCAFCGSNAKVLATWHITCSSESGCPVTRFEFNINRWNIRALTEREAKLVEALKIARDELEYDSSNGVAARNGIVATLKSLGIEGEG